MKPPRIAACCNKIIPHGTRCACQIANTRQRNKRHDRTRPSATQRGYSSKWRTARAAFLKINDRCAWPGCGKPAEVVDHITPHRGDMRLFWDRANWQPLCQPCHDRRKQRQERKET